MQKTIFNPTYRAMISELRKARIQKSLRQEDVAKRLGVSRNWVSKVERCEVRLDVLNYVRLCRALELCPREQLRTLELESRA